MLNDLSSVTRRLVVAQSMAIGMFLGLVLVLDADTAPEVTIGVMLTALLVFLACSFGFAAWSRRAQSRLITDVEVASRSIVRGEVDPVGVAGRTVRSRKAGSADGFLASRSDPLGDGASIVVATALAVDGPRRVAFLAPTSIASNLKTAPVALKLHPAEREVAVLDDLVHRDQLAAIAADPRWTSEELPTDRSVVGGWLPLVGSMLLGVTSGCGVVAIIAFAFT
ncbi:MAG: hypothetical protein ABJH68_03450 [Ilumatobacter sp.]|uniref:hypothetical protein n=1 Tax=Ilumatobacter sp. TaxID=1967498 RepID=UPI003299835B